jgi:drug/metabolite transporter (DMT)-like permease
VFGAFFLGERLGSRVVVGMLIATAGLVVVVGPADLQRAWQGLGDRSIQVGLAAGLTSGVIGGAATTTVRALRRTESALAIFGAFCAFGILVCAPMAWRDWRPVFSHAAWLLLLIGTLSFCAQMLFTYSLKFVTAGAGSLMTQLTVVASYSFAALFLGEAIQLHALVGGLVVMAGVLLVSLGSGVTPARSTVLPASAEVE